MRKIALICLFWLGLVPAGAVYALGLGEIRLNSALNQPMDAEIQLLSVRAGETDGMIVSLAPTEAFLRAGVERPFSLTQLRFQIELKPDGEPYIRVTTRKPIVEPFMNFLVEVDWPRGRLLKEYTVLLDPPVFMTDLATAGDTEAPVTSGGDEQGAAIPGAIVRSTTPEPAALPEPTPSVAAQPEPVAAAPEPEPLTEPQPLPEPMPEPMPAPEPAMSAAPAAGEGDLFPRIGLTEYDANRLPGGSAAVAAAPAEPTAPAYQGDTYGPVQASETLWGIANQVRPSSASVNQMMMALLDYNPEAFFEGNINNLRQGAVLRIPAEVDVLALDRASATENVAVQNAVWEQVRSVASAAQPAVSQEPMPETTGGELAVDQAGDDSSRLALVADEQGAESASSVAATTGDSAAAQAAQRELTLAQEELSSERLQNSELRDRVNELESIVANVENLINLRENEIADLQARLTELQTETAAEPAPMPAPEPQPLPEPVAEPEPMVEPEPEPEPAVTMQPETQLDTEPAMPEPATSVEPEQSETTAIVEPIEQQPMPATLPQVPARRGFVDQLIGDLMTGRILQNPVLLGIIGGVVALLLAVWLLVRRRGGGDEEAVEVDIEDLPDALDLDDDEGMTVEAVIDETLDEAEMEDEFGVAAEAPVEEAAPELQETVSLDDMVDEEEPAAEVEEEAPKDDTIAEADVYLAYGLYSQSEDLLKAALAEHPDRHEYHEKLLETHFAANNKDAFEGQAQVFHNLLGGKSSRLWDRVVAMGGELCPDNPLFSGAADLDISAQELQPAKPETPDLELGNEELAPDLDFGIDEEATYVNTGTDFDTGEIPLVDETIHEEDELDATQLLAEAPTLDIDDMDKGDTADHMELDTAEVDRVEEPNTVALEGDMEFDITASDLDDLGTPTDAFPNAEIGAFDDDEDDEEGLLLTSGEHPAVNTSTAEYDMSRIQDLIQGGSGETAIIPEIPDDDGTVELEADLGDPDFGDEQEATVEPEFEDDPGPNYNMGGTAEIPVMDDVDDFELDLEADAPQDEEANEPSVVSQLVTSVSEDMMDIVDGADDDEDTQLVSEIMPAITDDMLDKTIVQDAGAFRGEAGPAETDDEVETMLDLAKAYLDMGDSDSASSALEEIIAAGNERQRQEAQELLQKIS